MPSAQGDGDRARRPRSSTNSFVGRFAQWQRKAEPAPSATHVMPVPSLPLEVLLEVLTPPAVPSLSHARSLAGIITAQTQIPKPASLSPILATLCAADSPPAFQAAGYDVMAAYCEYGGASLLTLSDKLAYFALFTPSTGWVMELWEARLKALQRLTLKDTLGTEIQLVRLLRGWTNECFDGLFVSDGTWDERERGLEALSSFWGSLLGNHEFVARLPDEELTLIMMSLQALVDKALPHLPETIQPSAPGSPLREVGSPSASRSPSNTHRRQASSTSSASPLMTGLVKQQTRNALVLAANLYLVHLKTLHPPLSPECLTTVIPTLLRILAYVSSPFPAPSKSPHYPPSSSLEYRVTQRINEFLAGPYAATCAQILKMSLSPSREFDADPLAAAQLSTGAMRTVRNHVREVLEDRVASETTAQASSWTLSSLGDALAASVKLWVGLDMVEVGRVLYFLEARERLLEEATGILRDVVQAWDEMKEDEGCDEEEAEAVGLVLVQLVEFVKPLRNSSGLPYLLPLARATLEPNPLLQGLTALLSRDETRHPIRPPLPVIAVPIIDHLADSDSACIPSLLISQHALSPTTAEWRENWTALLASDVIFSPGRPLTRRALVDAIQSIQALVHDMPDYRRDLMDLVYVFWKKQTEEEWDDGEDGAALWALLSEEVVLRIVEDEEAEGSEKSDRSDSSTVQGNEETEVDTTEREQQTDHNQQDAPSVSVEDILRLMSNTAASAIDPVEDVKNDSPTPDHGMPSSSVPTVPPSASLSPPPPTISSPALSRLGSEFQHPSREQSTLPLHPQPPSTPLMSLLAPFRGGMDRTPVQPVPIVDSPTSIASTPPEPRIPRVVPAVVGLINAFCQLSLTPFSLSQSHLKRAVEIWDTLLRLLTESKSTHVRLTVLQFVVRLRADRDHAIYFIDMEHGLDQDEQIAYLANWARRTKEQASTTLSPSPPSTELGRVRNEDTDEGRFGRANTQVGQGLSDRLGRHVSRTRGGRSTRSTTSRSRSRAPSVLPMALNPPVRVKPLHDPIWTFPDTVPFHVSAVQQPSEGLITYDPDGPGRRVVLPVSNFVQALVMILQNETSWEVLSYVLCYLPGQLANKHFFCGPKARVWIKAMLDTLCGGIVQGNLGSSVEVWPVSMKARDAQGIATHILSVLISYRRALDPNRQHELVSALLSGLGGETRAVSCCLSALSIAAFDLQASTTKHMPRILEKLSQITSNAEMTVHIINFLAFVGSSKPLYANFTTDDFKMVFGVALQYLQHHNDPTATENTSWALSQHVLIMSYYIVYVWFLALKMPDRRLHVPYISRQLLLANERRGEVDEATEVCFDWIARYTYGSADPKPSPSLLSDIVMNPPSREEEKPHEEEAALAEKSWVVGNSVVTVRTLVKRGWFEIVSRRPSGLTKFLCKVENVPIVGPGEADPDMISIPGMLMMDRDPIEAEQVLLPLDSGDEPTSSTPEPTDGPLPTVEDIFKNGAKESAEEPDVDDIRGYVWSGVAPSQRRKEVSLDPSFFALQLSNYPSPNRHSARGQLVTDKVALDRFIRGLDRIPVIDTQKVGIMYVAPGQTTEKEILGNTHGSPAYTRFLDGIGRLVRIRGQHDIYIGGMDPEEDGEYAFAWWDDIGQVLFHTATMMPSRPEDEHFTSKKRHIGNDYVRIVWNDSGLPYRFDTLDTQFQFVNIVIEPHSMGTIAAFSRDDHETEFFKVTVQRAPGMIDFSPIGHLKLVSASSLPLLVRRLSVLADWFASIFEHTQRDTEKNEKTTHWRARLQAIKRFRASVPPAAQPDPLEGILGQQLYRDFTPNY